MTPSELTAVLIAVDELQSYVDVVQEDNADEEAGLRKMQWAVRKLHDILRGHDVVVPGVNA